MLGVVNECAYLFDIGVTMWYNIVLSLEVLVLFNPPITMLGQIRRVRYVRS